MRARAIVAFEDPKSSRFERRVGAVVRPSRREGRAFQRAPKVSPSVVRKRESRCGTPRSFAMLYSPGPGVFASSAKAAASSSSAMSVLSPSSWD